jgi:Fur family iron response transcriptional regulator
MPLPIAIPASLERDLEATRLPRSMLQAASRQGCPVAAIKARLKAAGLRPTRQRMILGWLLFAGGDRHITAEALFGEVTRVQGHLSLATVYNTLNQFRESGLIRQVPTGGGRAVFDTNTGDHHHYLVEADGTILDMPADLVPAFPHPPAPEGYRVVGVDVVVRLERLPEANAAFPASDEG